MLTSKMLPGHNDEIDISKFGKGGKVGTGGVIGVPIQSNRDWKIGFDGPVLIVTDAVSSGA